MSLSQQHRRQMIESHIRQYLPSGTGRYSQENMMSNLRILSRENGGSCPTQNPAPEQKSN